MKHSMPQQDKRSETQSEHLVLRGATLVTISVNGSKALTLVLPHLHMVVVFASLARLVQEHAHHLVRIWATGSFGWVGHER